jgi:peptide-methionine (S)-S-oxide reductase
MPKYIILTEDVMNKLILGIIFLSTLLLSPFSFAADSSTAIFAGGCFWCMQADFDKVHGVTKTIAGYTGGSAANPSYEQVSAGGTGHYEAVKVVFDPQQVTYKQLLDFFWKNIDPTNDKGQFCDEGNQYRAVIFYANDQQKKLAEASKQALITSGRFKYIATQILPAGAFYPAEDYHQKYYLKNPIRYKYYRYSCGRDKRLKDLWRN